MLLCAHCFDTNRIVNQADLVSLPIAFVEPLDDCAGKGGTLEAKINPLIGGTVFYFAFSAMFRLAGILPAASQARLFFFQMHIADRTGDPAGCQHGWGYGSVYSHR